LRQGAQDAPADIVSAVRRLPGIGVSAARRRLFDVVEGLGDSRKRATTASRGQSHQPEKYLRRDERVACCRVTIVRDHAEQGAQRVEREMTDGWTSGERAITLQVQRQIHRVQASVHQPHAPMPLTGRVDRRDVVADVMTDDHAVAEILQKPRERLWLREAPLRLIPRDTVHSDRFGVAIDMEQRRE
jgi:hypothetical protein